MTQNRYYSNTSQATTVTNPSGLNATETDLQVGATTGFPTSFPYVLRIEPATTNEEAVLITSGLGTSGSPFATTRGYDGTQQRSHATGVPVAHGFVQADFAEPQQHLNLTGSSSAAHGLPSYAWSSTLHASFFSTVLASNTTTININSIPQTATNLRLLISGTASTATTLNAVQTTFNADSGAHYGQALIYQQNSTTLTSAHAGNTTFITTGFAWGNSLTSVPGGIVIEILNYSNTTLIKPVTTNYFCSDTGTTAWSSGQHNGAWNNTSAITSISLNLQGGIQWAVNTAVNLYGVL